MSYVARVAQDRIDGDVLRDRYSSDGAAVGTIAAEHSVSPSTVYAALHAHGIPLRGRTDVTSRARQLTRPDLVRWLADGRTVAWIAERTGADWVTVSEYLASHGLATEPEGADDLRRWYSEEGCSIPETARRAGIGVRTARRRLLAAGVTLRPRGRPRSA